MHTLLPGRYVIHTQGVFLQGGASVYIHPPCTIESGQYCKHPTLTTPCCNIQWFIKYQVLADMCQLMHCMEFYSVLVWLFT